MVSKKWSAGNVLAGLLWVSAVILGAINGVWDDMRWGPLGVVVAVAAGTLQLACRIAESDARLEKRIGKMERSAREWFELGKQTAAQRPRGV